MHTNWKTLFCDNGTERNQTKLNNLANEIWKSAVRLRGKFKAYEYQSVILSIIVIRRLECVLIDWRKKKAEEIWKKRPDINVTNVARESEIERQYFQRMLKRYNIKSKDIII